MTRYSTTLRLALCCLAGLAAIYAIDSVTRAKRQSGAIVDFRFWIEDTDSIDISFPDGTQRSFVRTEGAWSISSPFSNPADDAQIKQLLDAIAETKCIHRISARESELRELSTSDFGLAPPSATLTIRSHLGDSHSVSFGIPPPAASNEIFAAIAGDSGISIIDSRAFEMLSRPIVDFSDRRLCRANLQDVVRISIERPGREPFRLIRMPDHKVWRISSPSSLAADWGEMAKFFDAVAQARISSFLADGAEPLTEENASFVIRLFNDKDPFPAIIAVGQELRDGSFSAIADGGALVSISADSAKSLDITPNAIRDRRVFASAPTLDVTSISISSASAPNISLGRSPEGDWLVENLANAPANQEIVSRMISEIFSLKAIGFVSAPTNAPAFTVAIATPSSTNLLACSHPFKNGTFSDDFCVTLEDATSAALAAAASLESVRTIATNPALAVSTHLGAFPARDILSISIVRDDGSSQRFDLAPDGSMSIGGDDAATEPISDHAEITARITSMMQFLSSIDALHAVISQERPSPRISVEIEPNDPKSPHLVIRFAAPDETSGIVLATVSDAPNAPLFAFPSSVADFFSHNFRESYHAAVK